MAPSRLQHALPEGTPLVLRQGLIHVPPIRTLPELHCELRSSGPEYALAALNAFVAPKYRFAANHEFVERSLDQAQRAFPEHNEVFTRLRNAYGIRTHLPSASSPASAAASSSRRNSRAPPLRHLEEQRIATEELHARLRGSSHADAVTALDDFLVDAISDWTSQFAINAVEDAERAFPEHAGAFAYIRSEWRLPLVSVGSLPVTPTSPRSPIMIPARPLSPASPRLGSSIPRSPLRPGLIEAPPEYAKHDPDPHSTRLLEQTLAAEADSGVDFGLGMTFLFPAPLYAAPSTAFAPPVPQDALPEDVDMADDDDHDVNDISANMGDIPMGGVPLERERNLSSGPTYTFTAEQLAGLRVQEPRRRARSEGPTRRGSLPQPPQRTTESPAARPEYIPPTYTFTAAELAGVGEHRRQSGWKVLIPRRVSVPATESPPKLFRSLSRGERI